MATIYYIFQIGELLIQGTIGCTPNRVPMVFVVLSLEILGDYDPINTHYIGLIYGISHRGTLVGVHPTIP